MTFSIELLLSSGEWRVVHTGMTITQAGATIVWLARVSPDNEFRLQAN